MNLLLISRCEEKLQATAAGIQRQHGVQCKYYRMDLAESAAFTTDEKIWSDLRELIDSLDVGVLVNCAGICYSFPERFEDLDDLTLHSIPAVNISSLAKMTYVVLPGMSKRKRGVIINVSSVAATRTSDGAPLTALYSASKAFVDFFSLSIAKECRRDGVLVQVGHCSSYLGRALQSTMPAWLQQTVHDHSTWASSR